MNIYTHLNFYLLVIHLTSYSKSIWLFSDVIQISDEEGDNLFQSMQNMSFWIGNYICILLWNIEAVISCHVIFVTYTIHFIAYTYMIM